MSFLTGKPYPQPKSFGTEDVLARFKAQNRPGYVAPAPAPAPAEPAKGIVAAAKDAVAKTFKKRK